MRFKILLILALMGAILVSSAVGTLSSYYTEASGFGISIRPDSDKIRQQAGTPAPPAPSAIPENQPE